MITFTSLFLGLVIGMHPVALLVSGPVAEVELFLDGNLIGVVDPDAPSINCDFGTELRPHVLLAIARDASGDEIDRVQQWINLPRSRAEAVLALEDLEGDRAHSVRLVWQSIENAAPERLDVRFDGMQLPSDGSGSYLLPDYDPRELHILTAELGFADGLTTRVESALGGRWGSDVTVEMTAVPVSGPVGQPPSAAEMSGRVHKAGRPLPVVAVDRGRADVVVVLENGALLSLGGHGRILDHQGNISDPLFELRDDEALRVLSTTPRRDLDRNMPFDIFPISRTFSGRDGDLPYLLTHVRFDEGERQQIADAVAVAGVQAAGSNRPRAVVLVLGSRWSDDSRFEPEQVRSFLDALRVPLVVWSTGQAQSRTVSDDRRPITIRTPWGRARDISSVSRFLDGVTRLRRLLDSQTIVWVEGSHLPTDLVVTDEQSPKEQEASSEPVLPEIPLILEPAPPRKAEVPDPAPMSARGFPPLVSRADLLSRLNQERGALDRPPLRLAAALNQAAQRQADALSVAVDLETELFEARIEGSDLEDAGYRAKRWVQALANSPDDVHGIVDRWVEQHPAAYQMFLDAELRDLGVGIGRANQMPLYSFVAALTYQDYYRGVVAALGDLEATREQIVQQVNRERELAGLPPLKPQYQLMRAAQRYAEAMKEGGFYGHKAPDGSTVLHRVKAAGYRAKRAGENLANGPENPIQAMDGWMASKEHRNNILSRRFNEIGVGIAVGVDEQGEYRFLWVQCFGRQRL